MSRIHKIIENNLRNLNFPILLKDPLGHFRSCGKILRSLELGNYYDLEEMRTYHNFTECLKSLVSTKQSRSSICVLLNAILPI